MPTPKLLFRNLALLSVFLYASCVKDVDLDQASEISLPPTAAVDLVYFTLGPDDFQSSGNNQVKAVDVVRLEFLDDDYIQDGLIRADLNFLYTNSFNRTFRSTIIFLSENDQEQYRISFDIPPGSAEDPERLNYTEIISGPRLVSFKRAIKMRIELVSLSGSGAVEGQLQLKSKAFFKLEFQ